ncbi:PREDICTED: uncharacterized protein At3g17950 [Ipomoea nil]|uniref:uncharacterized protein At3g17950 n=1 Tax=Ipomoea nil TaxID=35883 RepID=UPI0009019521|nr:PREDICTED: uncharacterized protein At3g17950 [Ipomoea nil]
MAQQEDGWPLGLQPLSLRVGLVRNNQGSLSFNTLLTASPPSSSTHSSSDLDTQSTGSFFHDKSIALGSLLGISSILEFSRRSTRGRAAEPLSLGNKKGKKCKIWLFSLCSKLSTDAVMTASMNATTSMAGSSLAHFLEAERKASATICREAASDLTPNHQFIAGNGEGNGHGTLLVSCLCGHLTH